MAMIKGRVYSLENESANELFRTIFPDLEKDAKYILISSEGMMTFDEEYKRANGFRLPTFQLLSYHEIEFENE